MVETLSLQCRECGFDSSLGDWDPTFFAVQPTNKTLCLKDIISPNRKLLLRSLMISDVPSFMQQRFCLYILSTSFAFFLDAHLVIVPRLPLSEGFPIGDTTVATGNFKFTNYGLDFNKYRVENS